MRKTTIWLFLCFLPTLLSAQSEKIFNDITLNESLEIVSEKLRAISTSQKLFSPKSVSFPLASRTEHHLICNEVKTEHGIIERVALTFSDGTLSYIEAHGNVNHTLASHRNDTARTYMDYSVYPSDRLFINAKKDIAWILTQEAMHVNLFTWENPYLTPDYAPEQNINSSNEIPDFLNMGGVINELLPAFDRNSSFTYREELDGSDPNAQLQINCFGVDYMGFPRKVEARFGDDKLNVVWILTGKGEEERIRGALNQQFGAPIFVNEDWEIFNNWQVGLRKDKPEVLLMEQEIGLFYKENFFNQ